MICTHATGHCGSGCRFDAPGRPDDQRDRGPDGRTSSPNGLGAPRLTTLPTGSAERKEIPLYEGLLKYFPAALAGVAQISYAGNLKHNGAGTPLRHSRGKSMDHLDCVLRHMVDLHEDHGAGVGLDENGVPQAFYIAWRALAHAQEWAEKNLGAPRAPGATEGEHALKIFTLSGDAQSPDFKLVNVTGFSAGWGLFRPGGDCDDPCCAPPEPDAFAMTHDGLGCCPEHDETMRKPRRKPRRKAKRRGRS